jgi:hypothetical protein
MSKRTKYDIGLGTSTTSGSGSVETQTQLYSLAQWNQRVQDAYQCRKRGEVLPVPFLPADMWNEWLWGFDPAEQCNLECLMNRSHLLGLLLARYRAIYQDPSTSDGTLIQILGDAPDNRISLFEVPVNTYSLRHLRDTVQNLQLNWVSCACAAIPKMKDAVDALLHRLPP